VLSRKAGRSPPRGADTQKTPDLSETFPGGLVDGRQTFFYRSGKASREFLEAPTPSRTPRTPCLFSLPIPRSPFCATFGIGVVVEVLSVTPLTGAMISRSVVATPLRSDPDLFFLLQDPQAMVRSDFASCSFEPSPAPPLRPPKRH